MSSIVMRLKNLPLSHPLLTSFPDTEPIVALQQLPSIFTSLLRVALQVQNGWQQPTPQLMPHSVACV